MQEAKDARLIPMTSFSSGKGVEVLPDVYYYTNQIVNFIFIGRPDDKEWFLIDAGMPKSGAEVIEAAESRFGKGAKPSCIILTHGHFDHVGGLAHILREWKVPVYAHP